VKYVWIYSHQPAFDVTLMCQWLEVTRSSYYDWLAQDRLSARAQENQLLSEKIRMIFTENKGRYGSRRIRRA